MVGYENTKTNKNVHARKSH